MKKISKSEQPSEYSLCLELYSRIKSKSVEFEHMDKRDLVGIGRYYANKDSNEEGISFIMEPFSFKRVDLSENNFHEGIYYGPKHGYNIEHTTDLTFSKIEDGLQSVIEFSGTHLTNGKDYATLEARALVCPLYKEDLDAIKRFYDCKYKSVQINGLGL